MPGFPCFDLVAERGWRMPTVVLIHGPTLPAVEVTVWTATSSLQIFLPVYLTYSLPGSHLAGLAAGAYAADAGLGSRAPAASVQRRSPAAAGGEDLSLLQEMQVVTVESPDSRPVDYWIQDDMP